MGPGPGRRGEEATKESRVTCLAMANTWDAVHVFRPASARDASMARRDVAHGGTVVELEPREQRRGRAAMHSALAVASLAHDAGFRRAPARRPGRTKTKPPLAAAVSRLTDLQERVPSGPCLLSGGGAEGRRPPHSRYAAQGFQRIRTRPFPHTSPSAIGTSTAGPKIRHPYTRPDREPRPASTSLSFPSLPLEPRQLGLIGALHCPKGPYMGILDESSREDEEKLSVLIAGRSSIRGETCNN